MATCAIWAVRRSVGDVLRYAENPEKTGVPDDDELKKVMHYAGNPDKTEQRYLVSGVNCLPELAYERMTATKKHYGKEDGIAAYHGYQSFAPGEVTPDQCHAIGVELAKRLWGDRFEVLVATHVDKESHLHNHFVVNSVSFRDGLKFRCTKSYHKVMWRESDKLCREYGLSVIQNPPRTKQPRGAWMAEKNGKPSHRSILKWDADDAIRDSTSFWEWEEAMVRRGYRFVRGDDYEHISVIAEGWQRPVRLDSLGGGYTRRGITKRAFEYYQDHGLPYPWKPQRARYNELLGSMEIEKVGIVFFVFMCIIELLGLNQSEENYDYSREGLSPKLRQELIYQERYLDCYNLIVRNDIRTEEDVDAYIAEKEIELNELEKQRRQADNRRRRSNGDPAVITQCAIERKRLTEKIVPLRRELGLAREIMPLFGRGLDALKAEYQTEERLLPEKVKAALRGEDTSKKASKARSKDYER